MAFKPALVVVDMQVDYCDPKIGKLCVHGGALDLAPAINQLLSMPGFVVRVATMNTPPKNHTCFPHDFNPDKKSHIKLNNTKHDKKHEEKDHRLWPAHCQPGTPGWELIKELDKEKIDLIVKKNMHEDVMMYSGFKDTHGNTKHEMAEGAVSHHLEDELTKRGITDVFCVGTAGDFCVAHTAIHAAEAGFKTYVLEDVVRNIDSTGAEFKVQVGEMQKAGITIIKMDSPEVKRVG